MIKSYYIIPILHEFRFILRPRKTMSADSFSDQEQPCWWKYPSNRLVNILSVEAGISEMLEFTAAKLLRKHLPRIFSLIKNKSMEIEHD